MARGYSKFWTCSGLCGPFRKAIDMPENIFWPNQNHFGICGLNFDGIQRVGFAIVDHARQVQTPWGGGRCRFGAIPTQENMLKPFHRPTPTPCLHKATHHVSDLMVQKTVGSKNNMHLLTPASQFHVYTLHSANRTPGLT